VIDRVSQLREFEVIEHIGPTVIEDPEIIGLLEISYDHVIVVSILFLDSLKRQLRNDLLLNASRRHLADQFPVFQRFMGSENKNRACSCEHDSCFHGRSSLVQVSCGQMTALIMEGLICAYARTINPTLVKKEANKPNVARQSY
jgi:hypothetical protein